MIIKDTESVDIPTSTGPMRTYLFRPAAEGRYPGLLLFSEIFQMTGLIREEKWDRLLCCEPYEAEAAFLPTHMVTPYADFVRRVGFPMMRARLRGVDRFRPVTCRRMNKGALDSFLVR
jgi:hypothetical protein